MELHSAEVWVTDDASLVVTIPYDEHNFQSETELRERLFRAVNHRFKNTADPDTFGHHVQSTQLGTLQMIEGTPEFDPKLPARPQYGVVLVRNGVLA